ncbi:MAG: response regulator transcription factor [Bryobacteraceae bacterium]
MLRVGIYTDEPMAIAGLTSLLSTDRDLLLVGIWDKPGDLPRQASLARPDILLLDMACGLPAERVEEIRRRVPECRPVCWTRTMPFENAIRLVEIGVQGIIPKTTAGSALRSVMLRVARGEQCIDETLFAPAPLPALRLTAREQQILSLISLGMKNREMASALSISEGTLKVYVSRLLQKTGLRDRHQLALFRLKTQPGTMFIPPSNGMHQEYLTAR